MQIHVGPSLNTNTEFLSGELVVLSMNQTQMWNTKYIVASTHALKIQTKIIANNIQNSVKIHLTYQHIKLPFF